MRRREWYGLAVCQFLFKKKMWAGLVVGPGGWMGCGMDWVMVGFKITRRVRFGLLRNKSQGPIL